MNMCHIYDAIYHVITFCGHVTYMTAAGLPEGMRDQTPRCNRKLLSPMCK